MTSARPRVGISACLLGESVRFDGGHKKSAYVTSTLARFVDLVPVCPEVESGMSVPRESLRLVRRSGETRLIGNRSGVDHTESMTTFAAKRATELDSMDLDGFILKRASPSCGLDRVRVYAEEPKTQPARNGVGLFASALRERLPGLALTEEGWLCDGPLRESFLAQLFTHHRLRTTLIAGPSPAGLVTFHTQHKLHYLAHSPAHYRRLGRIVGALAERPLATVLDEYREEAMAALARRPTPGTHANVLQHVMGYFRHVIEDFEKQEILEAIEEYRAGLHTLDVPRTLLMHHLRKHRVSDWLEQQWYFSPYPRALSAA